MIFGPSTGHSAVREGGDAARDLVLDLALPPRAALLEVAVSDRGSRFRDLRALPAPAAGATRGKGSEAYLEALRTMGVTATEVPFDDEARFRFRTTCRPELHNSVKMLRYRFSVLLELADGTARVAFPPAAELSPPPTRVEVLVRWPSPVSDITIAGAVHPVIAGEAPAAKEVVSTRSGWTVAVTPRGGSAERGQVPRLTALGALGTVSPGHPLLAYAVGAASDARRPLPERVLFVVDRSRSVGPGGLEAERDAARKMLNALPPSTRFDALFFDRTQQQLFPLTRTATREAMAALDQEMVPARLANGTDLAAALRATGDLLRRRIADFSPQCLLVILTDGAVGVPPRSGQLAEMLGAVPGVDLMVAALSIRPAEDPALSLDERRVLRGLAAAALLGGVERSIRSGDLPDAVPALLESLGGGGDVYGIGLRDGSGGALADVLEPGAAGVSGVLPLAKTEDALDATVTYRGSRHPLSLRPLALDGRWLQPLVSARATGDWLQVGPGVAALVEPVSRPPSAAAADDGGPRGYMERSVVRDSLSLAFTPRARACYLNRTAKTAADRDLTGRVRVALDLVRGEVADVRVDSSTLAHAGIETCLREAAYAIEVPRAYRNDEAVTAVLNLVFRPRSVVGDRRSGVAEDNPSLSRELDLIIEKAVKDQDSAAPADWTGGSDAGQDAARDRSGGDAGLP